MAMRGAAAPVARRRGPVSAQAVGAGRLGRFNGRLYGGAPASSLSRKESMGAEYTRGFEAGRIAITSVEMAMSSQKARSIHRFSTTVESAGGKPGDCRKMRRLWIRRFQESCCPACPGRTRTTPSSAG